ncbi:type I-MYXAN CRISPR-associated protein Cas5/Cmx5/DevS [Gloeothece verrucosa]|uniref:CRISPR-associated protein DevS n=1 Tax=Gloeothece verrucosa (strain PCC 7822) TaxID=497965 RepID=E0UMR4_GLOV7|nr:type I-MYXAN CRISPR-associated protein Cas5/Cmx5/DevS [Gloeothece verrucosa]ADN18244.1 CRISPR-associated protein DevS [Gloeothece verrucosa PCC 7822]
MSSIAVYIDVPFASFRQSHSREYGKTYPVPPPATVYGMLLSLVGEWDVYLHCGVQLAMAMISQPQISKVLRRIRRFKVKNFSDDRNTNPEYQEVLSNIKFIVWVASKNEQAQPTLRERIEQALIYPESVKRVGCLYLGESNDLVNKIKLISNDYCFEERWWLMQDEDGLIILPYWVDHVGSKNTRWLRYGLKKISVEFPPESCWTTIQAIR